MLDENKSKEVLANELKRLKDDYIKLESVSKTKKKYDVHLTRIERFLSQIIMEFVELPLEIDIYDFLAEKLEELFNGSIILISTYDEDSDSFMVCSISGQIDTLDELSQKFLGRSVLGLSVPRSINNDLLLTGHINRVDDGLHQLLLGRLSKSTCQSIEKLLCLEGIYNIGLSWKGRVYGAVDIGLKKGSKIENKEIVEVLVNMGAVVLERRTAENKILENNAKYRSYVDNAPYGIIVTDENGRYLEVNDMVCEITGYSKEELLKRGIPGLVPLNYLEGVTKELLYSQLTEQSALEFKFLHKNGQTRNGAIKCVKLPKKKYMGFLTDITERKKSEEELMLSRFHLDNAISLANMANWEFDVSTRSFIFNDRFYTMCGTTAEQEGGYLMSADDYIKKFVHLDDAQFVADAISKSGTNLEYRLIRQDGETRYIISNVKFAKDDLGNLINVYGTNQDITERKKVENALNNSENKYRTIFENVQDIFYQIDKEGNIIEISPSVERYSGYTPSELIGKPVETFYLNPEDRGHLLKKIQEKGEISDYEIILKDKDNNLFYVSTNAHVLFDSSKKPVGIEGSLRDITERKNIEIALKKSLEEKEMLLKEIHHRVKNNLMVISSLLSLQSQYIKDKESQDIFKESQNRAKSMALIHERLYQSTDLKSIDFGDYIHTLATDLFHTYVSDPGRVKLNMNVKNVMVDINTTVPLGLIVNELVTNSMKHAFPEGKEGEINIEFHKRKDEFILVISDTGVGFPEDIDFKNTDSLGLQLVNNLVSQIDGNITLDKSHGTEFKIKFKEFEKKL